MDTQKDVLQVLGSLMKQPILLSQTDKYNLKYDDFNSKFTKYIFGAIEGLWHNGAKKIDVIDIDNFLSTNDLAHATFEKNNGIEFLQNALEFAKVDNFDYYYNHLMKLNALQLLQDKGIDIKDFYCENAITVDELNINNKFEELSIQEILDAIKKKVLEVEHEYLQNDISETRSAADGLDALFDGFGSRDDVGFPLQGTYFNEITGGARLGTLTIRSGVSGLGKAIPNEISIPTPRGYRKVKEIQVGDFLWGSNGKPTQVMAVYPQPQPRIVYNIELEDGRVARACGDHLWSVHINTAQDRDTLYTFSTTDLIDWGILSEGVPRFTLPVSKPIKNKSQLFEIDPYLAGQEVRNIFLIHNDELQPCKTAEFKMIDYLQGSIIQRELFLNGVLGTPEEENLPLTGTIQTTHETVAKDLTQMFWSLGYTARCIPVLHLLGGLTYSVIFEKKERIGIVAVYSTQVPAEMTCFTVAATDALFLTEDFIVTHNTRSMVGDACLLAYPYRYDWSRCQWVQEGSDEKVLIITTEQDFQEIQRMMLAYLTGINESKFRYGAFSDQETLIIKQALYIMKTFQDNVLITRMPNPTTELIKLVVRENALTNDIQYCFYDYIAVEAGLLNEFKGFGLRNDEILNIVATTLKNLAVELNIFILSATQVNAKGDDNRNIRNEATLAGGRSTINKADYGFVMARPTPEELSQLANMDMQPNLVIDVFKVRAGEWTQVRIWADWNLGTCRRTDLFVTDARLEPIMNMSIDYDVGYSFDSTMDSEIREGLKSIEDDL